MRPVETGLWKLCETFDGTYTIDDLFDVIEILDVRLENKAREYWWRKNQQNGR